MLSQSAGGLGVALSNLTEGYSPKILLYISVVLSDWMMNTVQLRIVYTCIILIFIRLFEKHKQYEESQQKCSDQGDRIDDLNTLISDLQSALADKSAEVER